MPSSQPWSRGYVSFAVMANEASFQAPWVPRDRGIADLVMAGLRDQASEALRVYLDDAERQVLDVVRGQHAGRWPAPHPTRSLDMKERNL